MHLQRSQLKMVLVCSQELTNLFLPLSQPKQVTLLGELYESKCPQKLHSPTSRSDSSMVWP